MRSKLREMSRTWKKSGQIFANGSIRRLHLSAFVSCLVLLVVGTLTFELYSTHPQKLPSRSTSEVTLPRNTPNFRKTYPATMLFVQHEQSSE